MKKFENFATRKDKGVAGLSILLSLVTMLFVIGLLIMIFTLMSGSLRDTDSISAGMSASAIQNGIVLNSSSTVTLTVCNAHNQGVPTVATVINASTGGNAWTLTTDYVLSGCTIGGVSSSAYNNTLANVTYTYTYAGAGWDVANDTASAISETTDWFPIFIVIGAMVVLILLTVIIITTVRGSGLMGGNVAGGGQGGTEGFA